MALTKGHARNAAKTPLDQRLADMALVTRNADGSPRPGVLSQSGANLLTALATMHVAVAAAEFVTSKGKADGVMIFTNDGVVNVPIPAAPASNSRIDSIWVKQEDNTTGDAASLPIFGVASGAAAPVPTAVAVPTGALKLGELRVYSGTTAANGGANTLTNTFDMTSLRGDAVPFRSKALLDAWTTPAGPGQTAEVLLDATVGLRGSYRWNGTAWRRTGPQIAALARRATDFALTNGVFVAVPFDTLDMNDGPLWAGGNPTRFTAPAAGVYHFAGVQNQVNSTGNGDIAPRVNGVVNDGLVFTRANVAGAAVITWSFTAYLAAGDYVEIFARTSGGAFPWISSNRVTASCIAFL